MVAKNTFRFRLATQGHWMNGQMTSSCGRLVDALNGDSSGIISAEQVSVEDTSDGQTGGHVAECVQINTSEVLFAVLLEETRAPSALADPLLWIKKRPERVRIGIGQYVMVGNIHLTEDADLKGLLSTGRDRFLVATRVTIRRIDHPEVSAEHNVVILNRSRILFLMPEAPVPKPVA